MRKFCRRWAPLLYPERYSLYTLSGAFFARNQRELLRQWKLLEMTNPDEFLGSFLE